MKNVTAEELVNGINISIENVQSLIEDAELLYQNRKSPRAFTLSQLANEEVGKISMLFSLYLKFISGEKNEIDFKLVEKEFRDHKKKTFKATIADFMNSNKRRDRESNDFTKEIIEEMKRSKEYYNNLKNNSLYVNYSGSEFTNPKDCITDKIIVESINKAKQRLKDFMPHIELTLICGYKHSLYSTK